MDKLPVKRLDPVIYKEIKEELALNSKLRLILEILDNGFDSASPFSEEDEQVLGELKGLDEQALVSLQKETKIELSRYKQRY
jgi:hypothetical protein